MSPDTLAALERLYALIPPLECQGHCAASCGPIPLGEAEHARLIEAAGYPVAERPELAAVAGTAHVLARGAVCPLLTLYGRCSVYDKRPAICRLWGAVETMACPWGCEPKGGYLTHRAGRLLQQLAAELPV